MRFSPQLHRVWQRNPSRLLLLNILGGIIIVALLGSLIYPVCLASRPGAKPLSEVEDKGVLPWSPDFWADPSRYFSVYAYIPVGVLGMVLVAGLLLAGRDLREIPRYVELTGEGVKIGRWLAGEEDIPYAEITDVYERPFYGYVSQAVCFRTPGRSTKKICILKYAYDDWEEFYRQLRERTVLKRFADRLSTPA